MSIELIQMYTRTSKVQEKTILSYSKTQTLYTNMIRKTLQPTEGGDTMHTLADTTSVLCVTSDSSKFSFSHFTINSSLFLFTFATYSLA